ncbi:hypothetical protein EDC01DRAFT_784790 [Geopyxis carbonaria]|nr:hypothetical protein EDC01DRAFT_784790 [Geopyxis carbonaria]
MASAYIANAAALAYPTPPAISLSPDVRSLCNQFILTYHQMLQSKAAHQIGHALDPLAFPPPNVSEYVHADYLKAADNCLRLCKYMAKRFSPLVAAWYGREYSAGAIVAALELDWEMRGDRWTAQMPGRVENMRKLKANVERMGEGPLVWLVPGGLAPVEEVEVKVKRGKKGKKGKGGKGDDGKDRREKKKKTRRVLHQVVH